MALQQSNSSKQLDGPAKGMGKVAMAASLINNSNNNNSNNNNNNNSNNNNSNGRKALGDIGNLVVPQQQQLNPKGKDGGLQPQDNPALSKKAVVADRPITRSYGAQLAATDEEKVPTAAEKLGVNVYRRKPNPKSHLPPPVPLANHEKSSSTNESSDSVSARIKAQLSNNNIRKAVLAARERRGKTLTATLTARSEAACGGFDVKKIKAEEAVRDIDEGDIGNQLAVVDYVEDIYSFYRKTEVQSCVAADYMSGQSDISEKMRAILVDWLVEVHLKFKLMPETLFLTTNLLDRYLSVKSVTRKNLQLVGMTALLLAAKYEEIWAPEIKDFEFISDHAYSREEILDMEKVMLNTLRFNLTVPTPYVFLVRNLKAASFSHDQQQMDMLAFFLVELCLVDYKTMKFSPSMLAAAAVYIAHCYSTTITKLPLLWNATMERHSGYTAPQLGECARLMVQLHKNANQGKLTVVHKKYSLPKYGEVAKLLLSNLPDTLFGESQDASKNS